MAGQGVVARTYALDAPGANTDILTTAIEPKEDGVAVVTVCLTTSSVFNVTTTDGTTAYTNGLNASGALQAGDVYTFSFGVRAGISYNFQVETNSVVRFLIMAIMTDSVGTNSAQGA